MCNFADKYQLLTYFNWSLFLLLTLTWRPTLVAGEEIHEALKSGTVIANMLHVRAKPGEKYEVVSRLKFGDEIRIIDEHDDWLAIIAPPETEAWVATNRIKGGEIIEDNVPVYAGPGTIFSSFHKLNTGERVNIIRETNKQWTRIRPTDDFVVWIHRNYVRFTSPMAEEALDEATDGELEGHEEPIVIEADQKPFDESESHVDTHSQDNYLIHAIMPQPINREVVLIGEKEEIRKSGTIVTLDETNYPFQYALSKKINSTYYPLAYLSPDFDKLGEWVGKKVILSGSQSWIRGWPRPMIQIATIEPFEAMVDQE